MEGFNLMLLILLFVGVIVAIMAYRRKIKEECITCKDEKEEKYLEKEAKKAEKEEKIIKPKKQLFETLSVC